MLFPSCGVTLGPVQVPKAQHRGSQSNPVLNSESVFHPSSLCDTLSPGPPRAWGVHGLARHLAGHRAYHLISPQQELHNKCSLDLGIPVFQSYFMTVRTFFPLECNAVTVCAKLYTRAPIQQLIALR